MVERYVFGSVGLVKLMRCLRLGVVAGIAATACEAAWSSLEPALLGGRRPVFDTTLMAGRFVAANTGRTLDDRQARRLGTLMRLAYGPSWGVLLGITTARRRPGLVSATATLGLAIWLVEMTMLPRTRATPPLRLWPGTDVALDLSNTLIYAAVATLVVRAGASDSSSG